MITFDPERGRLTGPDDSLKLRPNERRILECLAKRRGRIVTRENLFEALYWHLPEADWPDTTKSLDVYIVHLRTHLQAVGAGERMQVIRTHHSRGLELTIPIKLVGDKDA